MTRKKTGTYYSGTSGLVLPVKNKSFYPPEFQDQSRLTYYGSLFNSIEINSSFYKMPRLATMQKWADSVPSDFRFTFKLWKEITHAKDLDFNRDAVREFMSQVDISDQKKGCLLVQFPPSLRPNAIRNLQLLIQVIDEYNPDQYWRVNFEFRDKSWYRQEIFDLLQENGCGIVLHDKTGSEITMNELDLPYIYLRFHGPGGNYRGSYDDGFLYEYATYIHEWVNAEKDVYVYFNNTMGDAVKNLLLLNQYVKKS
jgi:uncharacterized protein YecE (DUF72 family)